MNQSGAMSQISNEANPYSYNTRQMFEPSVSYNPLNRSGTVVVKSGLSFIVGALCLLASLNLSAQGDVNAGREKSFTCTGCHSAPGMRNVYPAYKVPKIGGQNADYLKQALRAYRDGARTHHTMHAQTAQFTDEDIDNVAAYFSQLPAESSRSAMLSFKGNASAGKEKATVCLVCHGEGNKTQNTITPIISGQYEDYILHALRSYKSGDRSDPVMGATINAFSDADFKDLAAYYAALESSIFTPSE